MIRKSILALAGLILAGAAHASPYTFTGSFDTASATTVITGTFSFSDAQVAAAGGDGQFDLTDLSVSFMGQTWSLGDATDPYVQFEGGVLTGPNALFKLTDGSDLALQSFFGFSGFTYASVGGVEQLGTLSVAAATVPEPASLALVLGGLVAIGAITRRRAGATGSATQAA